MDVALNDVAWVRQAVVYSTGNRTGHLRRRRFPADALYTVSKLGLFFRA